jgi:hypothetical protein
MGTTLYEALFFPTRLLTPFHFITKQKYRVLYTNRKVKKGGGHKKLAGALTGNPL